MTIEEIIQEFSREDCVLPKEAMQWSLDHWEEVLPSFISALNDPSIGPRHPNDPRFFIFHLLGEMKEQRAHEQLCRLSAVDPEEIESILGGTTTEGLGQILISTFDGDPASLMQLIEAAGADQYIRSQALDALTYVYAVGRIADFDMLSYVRRLGEELEPKLRSYVWTTWAETVARFGYEELLEVYKSRAAEGLIEEFTLLPSEFEGLFALSKQRGPLAVFEHDRIKPYGRAIETLSTWHAFSPEAQRAAKDEGNEDAGDIVDDYLDALVLPVKAENPYRNVGRNDPCPCASGKKFKKCCLASLV